MPVTTVRIWLRSAAPSATPNRQPSTRPVPTPRYVLTATSESTSIPREDRIDSPRPALTAMYSSAPTIPTTRPTTSLAAMTRSRLGVTTNVELAVPWRYSFVDSSAPSVNMNTIARCVPIAIVATERLRRSSMSLRPVTSPAVSPSSTIIAPSSIHVVRTETSLSHSECSAFIARCPSRR